MNFRKSVLLIAAIGAPIWAQTAVFNQNPARAFGQLKLNLTSTAPNLVEGRELYNPQGIAFDTTVNPPIVYVADAANNRVLAWKDATAFTKGDKADKAIGQPDLITTRSGGPRFGISSGLAGPTAVIVDGKGNLYVADAANNRIVRYPQPLAQTSDFPQPDFVLGQKGLNNDDGPNQGSSIPNAGTLYLGSGGSIFTTSMAFDKAGNLWIADSGNNRVLRYPASALSDGVSGVDADLVLGQPSFTSKDNPNPNTRTNKQGLAQPDGLAFSADGDLYVSDAYLRVLYFKAPFTGYAQSATRILGVVVPSSADPNPRTAGGCPTAPPYPCEGTLGTVTGVPPQGIATAGNSLFVADTGNHRIVQFDTPDKWPGECLPTSLNPTCPAGTKFSPDGIRFIGQLDGQNVKSNRGAREASAIGLSSPSTIAFLGTDLYVADAGNNRVLVFPQTGGQYTSANRVLGQIDFNYSAPNLIVGQELYIYAGTSGNGVVGGGIPVVDTVSNPPRLYIADTLNNRVLGFADARKVKPGDTADIVIGQADLFHNLANFASTDASLPTEATLNNPIGLAIDSDGNLFVADTGNGRVLRFPRPFDQTGIPRANLVLGQVNFFTKLTDASRTNLRAPYGLAFTTTGDLLVSDTVHNRVLLYRKGTSGFTNGQAAAQVIGQPDFQTTAAGNDLARFSGPRGIATDSSDRLYVCDTGNGRVSVFTGVLIGEVDPPARFTAGLNAPHSIAINRAGEIWVAETGNNRVVRFPFYEQWAGNPTTALATIPVSAPFGIALDAVDNVIVAEATNRVSFFFVQAVFRNAASYSQRGPTPGGLYYIARQGPSFLPTGTTGTASSLPWPTSLADVSVIVNGSPAPIYRVTPDIITFQVPSATPINQPVDFTVQRTSTQEVLAFGSFRVISADPAFFTSNAQGFGQIAALNDDGSVNAPGNGIGRGKVIALFGTGLGLIPNQPPDGQGASGALATSETPKVAIIPGPPGFLPDTNIKYFGLAPGLPGVFQLNVLIPTETTPTNTAQVAFTYRDWNSNVGPGVILTTTIVVK